MKYLIALLAFFSFNSNATVNTNELADKVLVEKSKNKMTLFRKGKEIAHYHVVFGGNPTGHKQQEGDERTPEGKYVLDFKKPNSAYYKAIHISYPNAQDIARAKAKGKSAGGDIMIHGQKNGFEALQAQTQKYNWTIGCIALTNEDMDLFWNKIKTPTAIEIIP